MNLPFRPPKKKKLQAATARRIREADYTEEPNVKLSNAFIVVLLLHVVTVGGIYAFSALKSRQPAAFDEADSTPAVQQQAATQTVANAQATEQPTPAATPAPTHLYRVKTGDTIAKIALVNNVNAQDIIDLNNIRAQGGIHVGEQLTLPGLAQEDAMPTPAGDTMAKTVSLHDSGNTYTVVHGDTLVSIAKKLHVGFDDLMRLNKIEDPKKLRIGLKLKVPAKHQTA